MKKIVFATLCVAAVMVFSAPASAEDNWPATEEGRVACVTASNSPFYYPDLTLPERRLPKGKVYRGHPTGGCFRMVLPDRLRGKGWVRIELGRKFVYDEPTMREETLAACNNEVDGFSPFPPALLSLARNGTDGAPGLPGAPGANSVVPGPSGAPGPQGIPGKNCSVKENTDGTKTITCAETQVVVENGEKGDPGSSCTVRDNGNGTKSIICEDRTSVLVSDGARGPQGPQGPQRAPAPLSWSQENPWLYRGLWVAGVVAGYLICKNNCAHWLGLEAPATAAAPAVGVGTGAIISPAF